MIGSVVPFTNLFSLPPGSTSVTSCRLVHSAFSTLSLVSSWELSALELLSPEGWIVRIRRDPDARISH